MHTKVTELNVGNRYVEFFVEDGKEERLVNFIQNVVRAVEEEMHQIINSRCDAIRRDCYFEIDNKVREMKQIFKDILESYGHEISMSEIEEIFKERMSERLPF